MAAWQTVLRDHLARRGHQLARVEIADDDLWTDAEHLVVWVRGEIKPFVCPSLGTTPQDTEWLETIALRLDARIRARRALRVGAIVEVTGPR